MQRSFLIVISMFLIGTVVLLAQAPVDCAANLERLYVAANQQCSDKPDGFICNGGLAPIVEPDGPVSNSLANFGAVVDANVVDFLRTPNFTADGNGGGLLWVRSAEAGLSALMLGDVSLRNTSPPELPRWQSFTMQAAEIGSGCLSAPYNGMILQNPYPDEPTYLTINGVLTTLNGTVFITSRPNADRVELVFAAMEGELQATAMGQTRGMIAGQQLVIPYLPGDMSFPAEAPTTATLLDRAMMVNLPVALLDRPVLPPEPGYVMTDSPVNMRTAPSENADLIQQVPTGQMMTILGRNPNGDWYHVRLLTGETGWMFADLLQREHGDIQTVYSTTPVPPQYQNTAEPRGRIITATGAVMREQPFSEYDEIYSLSNGQEVALLARSPYGPWVKVDIDGISGWIALIALETNINIDLLPVDYSVQSPEPLPPPGPTVTPVPEIEPGTWGNAFPDPSCYPNCD